MNQTNTPEAKITVRERGIVSDLGVFLKLNFVDWRRYRPWKNEQHAMEIISSSFINRWVYTIADVPLPLYPHHDGFPNWEHVGDHVSIGKLFWNHFHTAFDGELRFHDMPDFSGVIRHPQRTDPDRTLWGDIGKVSPIALRETMESLNDCSMWWSVINEHTQVILEPVSSVEFVG